MCYGNSDKEMQAIEHKFMNFHMERGLTIEEADKMYDDWYREFGKQYPDACCHDIALGLAEQIGQFLV